MGHMPNILTAFRIFLIPVFVVLFYLPKEWGWGLHAAAAVFLLGAVTDWLDGYVARRMGLESSLGAFLDPVADKLMVTTALILLVEADPTPWISLPVVIIIGREITISALREWMATLGERARVAVHEVGKIKTAAQMAAIIMMIYRTDLFELPIYTIGLVLLYVAAALTLWSMTIYIHAALPSLLRGQLPKPEHDELD